MPEQEPDSVDDRVVEGHVQELPAVAEPQALDSRPLTPAQQADYRIDQMQVVARRLQDIIRKEHLSTQLPSRGGPKEYVQVEGWQYLAALMHHTTRIAWCKPLEDGRTGFVAYAELLDGTGRVVGGAQMECSTDERNWSNREPYALQSMAQTRAVSKAIRLAFGFIMAAAGYEATPVDEMPTEADPDTGEVKPVQWDRDKPEPQQANPAPASVLNRFMERAMEELQIDREGLRAIFPDLSKATTEELSTTFWRKVQELKETTARGTTST